MLLNLVPKFDFVWIVYCSWSNHTKLLMFVAEKVLLLLVISLTAEADGNVHYIRHCLNVLLNMIEIDMNFQMANWIGSVERHRMAILRIIYRKFVNVSWNCFFSVISMLNVMIYVQRMLNIITFKCNYVRAIHAHLTLISFPHWCFTMQ